MASTETLSSLAMLKVNIDQGKDYLDYLRPFVLQVLVDNKPDLVTDQVVCDFLRTQFGLEIPPRVIQVVLKRLSRAHPLKLENGVYRVTGALPDPGIAHEKTKANRHIQAVISGLLEYDKDGSHTLTGQDDAVSAMCGFLSEFNIPCLRAYLRGTAIPTENGKQKSHIILVSDYVLHLQRTDPERFDSFMVLVQGHMLANALLCPDLQNAPKSYKGVTFYLDTPLLIQLLGLEGEPKERAARDLINLVKNLGGVIAAFSHSRDELVRVLKGAADHIDAHDGRSPIVTEARRKGTTRSDLILLSSKIDEALADSGVEVKTTPSYISDYQIDEIAFGRALEDEVTYWFNPRAKEDDINSVRSIYVLRANTAPTSVEKCKAVLVSSNTGFARAAYEYGKQFEATREVSSVITDFSLANMAWLKAPMGAPSIPMTELLSYSYAALQPSKSLLDKYLFEIDKLQSQGKISERDHQILRSSTIAQEELMRLTLGNEAALTEETVSETLRRVTNELKKEEGVRVEQEMKSHANTQKTLAETTAARNVLQGRIYWGARFKAKTFATFIAGIVGVLLICGIAAGLGLKADKPILGWILLLGSFCLAMVTIFSALFGTTVRHIYTAIYSWTLTHLLKRESKATGIDFGAS